METRKIGKVLLAFMVAAALTGLTPAVSGANEPDAITRTFDSFVFAEFTFKNSGTGIYDFEKKASGDDPKQPCPISILGLRAIAPDMIYYQSDRQATNLALGITEIPLFFEQNLGTPCPIPGTDVTNDQSIVIEDLNVKNPYDAVSVDQLLCTKRAFVNCVPIPFSGEMLVAACHFLDTHFFVGKKVGSLPPGVGSGRIECNGSWTTKWGPPILFYNETSLCDDFFFATSSWGTSDCLVQNEQIVPFGAGSSYLTSCMTIDYLVVDENDITEETATSHDYKLIKDLGRPQGWAQAKDWHWATGQFVHPNDPPLGPLQGWHDLSGQNGCPIEDGNHLEWDFGEKKKEEKTKENQVQRLLEALL